MDLLTNTLTLNWISICIPIAFISVLRMFLDIRKSGKIVFFIHGMNFVISLMMGISFAYITYSGWLFYFKEPTPDYVIKVGGGLGAILSYAGYEWIADRIGGFIDKLTGSKLDKLSGKDYE